MLVLTKNKLKLSLVDFSQFHQADVTKEHLNSVISGLENRLIKWMIGSFIAFAVLMLAIIQINTSTTNERITALERSIDQRMTALERAIDQRLATLEKSIDQNQTIYISKSAFNTKSYRSSTTRSTKQIDTLYQSSSRSCPKKTPTPSVA